MDEQLPLFGEAALSSVPPVTFREKAHRRALAGEQRPRCAHCRMNLFRFRANLPVEGWVKNSDIVLFEAEYAITQRDGSTLELCVPHARQHEERGKTGE